MSISRLFVIIGAPSVLGGALSLNPGSDHSDKTEPSTLTTTSHEDTPEAMLAGDVIWTPGYTYRFKLQHEARTRALKTLGKSQVIEGHLNWEATLAFTPTQDHDDIYLLAEIEAVASRQFIVLGQEVSLLGLTGTKARVELTPEGSLGEITGLIGDSQVAQQVFSEALHQLRYEVSSGRSDWESDHPDALGAGGVHYEVTSASDEGWSAIRRRGSYQSLRLLKLDALQQDLQGQGVMTVNHQGELDALEESLSLTVQDTDHNKVLEAQVKIKLQHLNTTNASRRAETQHAWRASSAVQDKRAHQSALRDRVGDMSLKRALDELALHAGAQVGPQHSEWLWRVTGLLKQNPELCLPFAQGALAAEEGFPTQRLALDVLASTGHAQAQAAMVHLFGQTQLSEGADRHRMIQSFMMLQTPTAETVQFVEATYQDAGPEALGAANTLGVLASQLSRRGDTEGSAALVQELTVGLAEAEDLTARRAHLMALGNSRHPEALPSLLDASGHDHVEMRRVATRGLARQTSAEAHEALLELVMDSEATVAAEALRGLSQRGLESGDLDRLARRLDEVELPLELARALVSAAERGLLPASEAQMWMRRVIQAPLPRRWIERASRIVAR